MTKTYIFGYDKTAVDKCIVKLTFNNIYKGTLVPTFQICDDLKMHQHVDGYSCQYKETKHYCVTLCSNCVEVLRLIHKEAKTQ